MENTDNKQLEAEKSNEDVEIARSVSHQEFLDYFNACEAKYGELACPMCKTSLWIVSPQEGDSLQPLMVTLPLPMVRGVGVWSFPVFCSECGYTVMYNTNHVARKIKGKA